MPARAAAASPALLQQLRAQDLRVARVAYRLALANRAFCAKAIAPQSGFALHGVEQYEPADRGRVVATFGLGAHVGVIAVVQGSPAERAGLRADDQIVAVNGRNLDRGIAGANEAPSRVHVELAQDIISDEMTKGAVTLSVTGANGERDITFVPEFGCSTNVELLPGSAVNAWADGERVVIGAGLLERCQTDDNLALVIGHELAHNLLGHSRRLAAALGTQASVLGLRGSSLAMMRESEEEADRLAVTLVTRAAYDVSGAEAFMSGLLSDRESTTDTGLHPATDRRLRLLRAEVAEARNR